MHLTLDSISETFRIYACEILADTQAGISGGEIVRITTAQAVECGRAVPHARYPFEAGNKRTARADNLSALPPREQFRIMLSLCDHPRQGEATKDSRNQLKLRLLSQYGHLDSAGSAHQIDARQVKETRHWLASCPESAVLLDAALQKMRAGC